MEKTTLKTGQEEGRSAQWVAGLAAATAATAATGAAQAATVQIDLVNNSISSTEGTVNYSTDLSGGGSASWGGQVSWVNAASVHIAQNDPYNVAYAIATVTTGFRTAYRAVVPGYSTAAPGGSVTGFLRVTFSDPDINGGAASEGFLEVTASAISAFIAEITLNRLVFDDASTTRPSGVTVGVAVSSIGSVENGVFSPVPEPSSFGLLALGAGGVALRRQRKKSA